MNGLISRKDLFPLDYDNSYARYDQQYYSRAAIVLKSLGEYQRETVLGRIVAWLRDMFLR